MNNLFLLTVMSGRTLEKFIVSIDTSIQDSEDVINKLKTIYGDDIRVIQMLNTDLSKYSNISSALDNKTKNDMDYFRRYIFFDNIINDFRIITFNEPNTSLLCSNINIKLVVYGNISDTNNKVIDNYLNMRYPLGKVDRLYANDNNISDILKLVSTESILLVTDNEKINNLYKLAGYDVKVLMVDGFSYSYDVKKEYNKLSIELINW